MTEVLALLIPLAIDWIPAIVAAFDRDDMVDARRLTQQALARQAFEERRRARSRRAPA